MNNKYLLSYSIVVAAIASLANAATIIDFDYSGVAGNVSQTKTTFELTSTTTLDSNVTINEGVNFKSQSVLSSSTAGGQASNDLNLSNWGASTSTTIAHAINGFRYISFTIQADAGYELNLDGASLNFTAWRNGTGAPERFGATAQVGAGTTDANDQIGANIIPYGFPGSSGIGNVQSFSFVISGASWDGITDNVEFRLYGWEGTGNMHIQDTSITNATVTAVPEPSSTAILGLGGLALILRRRK